MKVRDSGMPEERTWNSFFDPECVIEKLFGANGCRGDVVEFGSGYGTFTIPAAGHSTGTVLALDIDPDLVEQLQNKSKELNIPNIHAEVRNFVADGTGLESASQSHAMIYNILHLEDPVELLREAHRVLEPGGRLSVMHWRSDIPTPRGPALDIRPTSQQCKNWLEEAGFNTIRDIDLSECCAFHYGIVGHR